MSEIKVNKISPRTACGTTTLGDTGDTFTIPAGVTITNSGTAAGFGATGAASWDTTVKTGDFTAVAGVGYFVNTTSGEIDVTLPAGTAGDVVAISDYAKNFATNNCILIRNGSDKVGGAAVNPTLRTNGQAVTLVFVDATKGWIVTDDGNQSSTPTVLYVAATGGTPTTSPCGDFKIHTFTGPGTFCVSNAGNACGSNSVEYLVVAGGGGTDSGVSSGGGAGGFRTFTALSPTSPLNGPGALPVSVQGYTITVGGGGTAGPQPGCGSNGSVTTFSTITSTGGGVGQKSNQVGTPGGSGSGGLGSPSWPGTGYAGGTGNTPPVSPPQGQNGGAGGDGLVAFTAGGGGGGAGQVGAPAEPGVGGFGAGGNGSYVLSSGFAGSNGTTGPVCGVRYFSGGGGGGINNVTSGPNVGGTGGAGGGGNGASQPTGPATDGTANTGGGAGGETNTVTGRTGGSGIVIIRYKFQN